MFSSRQSSPASTPGGTALILVGDLLLAFVLLYFFVGAAYAFHFCSKVAGAVNVRARYSSPSFRLMLAPGAVLLWPLLWSLESRGQLGSEDPDEEQSGPSAPASVPRAAQSAPGGSSAVAGAE
jgi:hypothetical protein